MFYSGKISFDNSVISFGCWRSCRLSSGVEFCQLKCFMLISVNVTQKLKVVNKTIILLYLDIFIDFKRLDEKNE